MFIEEGTGPARFETLNAPGDEELEAILARIVRRTAKVLERLEEDFELDGAKDALAGIQAEQVQQRLRHPEPFEPTRRSAFLEGYSLHAGVRVHGNDLQGREQLCRYILRPPLALHRLSRSTDGALLYRTKRPRRGSLWLRLTPGELLAKLATLIPPPRVHGVRYHGVFAPNSRMRRRVVPEAGADAGPAPAPSASPAARRATSDERRATSDERRATSDERRATPVSPAPPVKGAPAPPPRRSYRVPWAELLRKVFAVDVLACPKCEGRLEMIAFISDQGIARKILEHLELDAPPVAAARRVPESIDPTPDYDVADPVYEA